MISSGDAERLLVADNLSDDVLLIDAASGSIEKRFDVSTSEWVPASFPYAVIATKDGKRAWVSLWNASQVAELDLEKGTVARWIKLHPPKSATDPGSHPTAMALGGEVESALAVTLANTDEIAIVNTANGIATLQSAALPGQSAVGAYPNAVAFNENGTEYFVANASSDAVGVFDLGKITPRCQRRVAIRAGRQVQRSRKGLRFHSHRVVSHCASRPRRRTARRQRQSARHRAECTTGRCFGSCTCLASIHCHAAARIGSAHQDPRS